MEKQEEQKQGKKKFRRGVISHVGVMLSFVIFITFIIFIYIIIKPALQTENKQKLLDYTKDVITEKSSAELTGASVLVDAGVSQTCVKLVNFLDKIKIGNRVIAKNDDGNVLDAKILGQDLFVERGGAVFLKIYSSEEFDITETGTMTDCGQLSEGSGYVLGLVRTEKDIFEKGIIQLFEDYNNNYGSLKEELNIPSNEFSLGFAYANGTVISTEEKEVSVSVFADEIPVQYISRNAARELGSLNVGIW